MQVRKKGLEMPKNQTNLFRLFQVQTGGRTTIPMPKFRVPQEDLAKLTGYQPPLMRKYWR